MRCEDESDSYTYEKASIEYITENTADIPLTGFLNFRKDSGCQFYSDYVIDTNIPMNFLKHEAWVKRGILTAEEQNTLIMPETDGKPTDTKPYLRDAHQLLPVSDLEAYRKKAIGCDLFLKVYKHFNVGEDVLVMVRVHDIYDRGNQFILFRYDDAGKRSHATMEYIY